MKSLLTLHRLTFQQHIIYLNHNHTWIGARNSNKKKTIIFLTKLFFKSSTGKRGCGSNYERIIKIIVQGAN